VTTPGKHMLPSLQQNKPIDIPQEKEDTLDEEINLRKNKINKSSLKNIR